MKLTRKTLSYKTPNIHVCTLSIDFLKGNVKFWHTRVLCVLWFISKLKGTNVLALMCFETGGERHYSVQIDMSLGLFHLIVWRGGGVEEILKRAPLPHALEEAIDCKKFFILQCSLMVGKQTNTCQY